MSFTILSFFSFNQRSGGSPFTPADSLSILFPCSLPLEADLYGLHQQGYLGFLVGTTGPLAGDGREEGQ